MISDKLRLSSFHF